MIKLTLLTLLALVAACADQTTRLQPERLPDALTDCFDLEGPLVPNGPWRSEADCVDHLDPWLDDCLAECERMPWYSDFCWDQVWDAYVEYPCKAWE